MFACAFITAIELCIGRILDVLEALVPADRELAAKAWFPIKRTQCTLANPEFRLQLPGCYPAMCFEQMLLDLLGQLVHAAAFISNAWVVFGQSQSISTAAARDRLAAR